MSEKKSIFALDLAYHSMTLSTTIEEQIAILKERGIVITDENKAKEVLTDKGYFRLCTYFFPFRITYPHRTNNRGYREGTTFEDGLALYYFDVDLRRIMQYYLARIEVAVRSAIIYEVSNFYRSTPTWYIDPTIVSQDTVDFIAQNVYTNKFIFDHPVIRRHNHKHPHTYAPAWKTLEYMTFGAVMNLFNSINSVDARRLVTKRFGIDPLSIFYNYFSNVSIARNICAHGSALFDVRLCTAFADGPAGHLSNTGNKQNLQGIFTVVYYLLTKISTNRASDFKRDIQAIFEDVKSKNPAIYAQLTQITGYNITFFEEKC